MTSAQRYAELDLLRTIAIICMAVYHTAFDLSQFYDWEIDVFDGGWKLLARGTAILFLLLVGTAAAVSDDRAGERSRDVRWKRHLRRFMSIGAGAFIVSLATYAADPETYIRFGILHLIAVSALILPLTPRLKWITILPGIILIALPFLLPSITANTELLLPFGIKPAGFRSVDYFPMIPWFGVILIGYAIGYWAYVKGTLKMKNEKLKKPIISSLTWPGRHALMCYMLHQPIIIALLWLILGRPTF